MYDNLQEHKFVGIAIPIFI